jgi:hypothetical protein
VPSSSATDLDACWLHAAASSPKVPKFTPFSLGCLRCSNSDCGSLISPEDARLVKACSLCVQVLQPKRFGARRFDHQRSISACIWVGQLITRSLFPYMICWFASCSMFPSRLACHNCSLDGDSRHKRVQIHSIKRGKLMPFPSS